MARHSGFPEYVPVAAKKAKAQKQIEKLKKKNPNLAPIIIQGRNIAITWWSKAWNTNLESYADYANRISRGRNYVRNGAVLDLKINKGEVQALVQGSTSKPYKVEITITPLADKRLEELLQVCQHKIDTLTHLLEGKFPKELAELFTLKNTGLFPTPKEITFNCSCPDWAYMCKHVTAVLYGIGARFDEDATLFFKLRDIDFGLFLQKTIEDKMDSMLKNANKKTGRALDEDLIGDLFGL